MGVRDGHDVVVVVVHDEHGDLRVAGAAVHREGAPRVVDRPQRALEATPDGRGEPRVQVELQGEGLEQVLGIAHRRQGGEAGGGQAGAQGVRGGEGAERVRDQGGQRPGVVGQALDHRGDL